MQQFRIQRTFPFSLSPIWCNPHIFSFSCEDGAHYNHLFILIEFHLLQHERMEFLDRMTCLIRWLATFTFPLWYYFWMFNFIWVKGIFPHYGNRLTSSPFPHREKILIWLLTTVLLQWQAKRASWWSGWGKTAFFQHWKKNPRGFFSSIWFQQAPLNFWFSSSLRSWHPGSLFQQ